ncbi:hypothetical protein D3874_14390 [Oleomonas cavernae]|uniref:Uncharacterized protein n=1 Tax=Oleomonas cavernae TaxID=2320859 RepID=A0A418WDM9_9PROT|nr:hypothetical protein [Oleomonas cavernae]RJF88059.1 hypothetical protein D3874_14390 [Oleomonas cavernae]
MSAPAEVHFEVSVLDGNGDWQVVEIQTDEVAARAVAKDLLAKGGIAGVRVAMESFNGDTQRFHGRLLWETQVQRPRHPASIYQAAKAPAAAAPIKNIRDFAPGTRRPVPVRSSWWRRLLGLGPATR